MARRRANHQQKNKGGGKKKPFGVGAVRIRSGRFRGRKLPTPDDRRTRPMLDRVRGALFDSLQSFGWLQGAYVADLFAGTGALGFEALSRGALRAYFFERDPAVAASLRQASSMLELGPPAVRVLGSDVLASGDTSLPAWLGAKEEGTPVLVFSDPPYAFHDPPDNEWFRPAHDRLIRSIARPDTDGPRPRFRLVVGHDQQSSLPETIGGWPQVGEKTYGRCGLAFFGDEDIRDEAFWGDGGDEDSDYDEEDDDVAGEP